MRLGLRGRRYVGARGRVLRNRRLRRRLWLRRRLRLGRRERLLAHGRELRIVLVSSHDSSSCGPRVKQSGAIGFPVKADLSGAGLERLLE